MSKKLKAAIFGNKVEVANRTSGEVMIRYMDRNRKRAVFVLHPFTAQELAPKLTDPALLNFSNLTELVKKGSIKIL
jgi:hypothetical protein